jgi:hypothetical protein
VLNAYRKQQQYAALSAMRTSCQLLLAGMLPLVLT